MWEPDRGWPQFVVDYVAGLYPGAELRSQITPLRVREGQNLRLRIAYQVLRHGRIVAQAEGVVRANVELTTLVQATQVRAFLDRAAETVLDHLPEGYGRG